MPYPDIRESLHLRHSVSYEQLCAALKQTANSLEAPIGSPEFYVRTVKEVDGVEYTKIGIDAEHGYRDVFDMKIVTGPDLENDVINTSIRYHHLGIATTIWHPELGRFEKSYPQNPDEVRRDLLNQAKTNLENILNGNKPKTLREKVGRVYSLLTGDY